MPLHIEGADAQKTNRCISNPWYPRTEDNWQCHVDINDPDKVILNTSDQATTLINSVGTIGNLSLGSASIVKTDEYGRYLNYTTSNARYVANPIFRWTDVRNICFGFVVHPLANITLWSTSAGWNAGMTGQRYLLCPQQCGSYYGIGLSLGQNGLSLYRHKAGSIVPYLTIAHTFERPSTVMIIHRSGSPTEVYIDGVLKGSNLVLTPTTYQFELYLGSIFYGTYVGKLYDFLMYYNTTTPISENLRLAAEGYLAHKRQINNYLPVNHIYKTTIPRLTV